MSDVGLSVSQRTLQHRLEDIPPSTLPHVKVGFSLLDKVEADKLDDVVDYVVGSFTRRSRYDAGEAAVIAGIDRNIVGDMLSSIALTVGAVFDIEVTKADFFDLAPAGLIEDQSRPIVGKILDNVLLRKKIIKEEVDRSSVANAVLPSFKYLDSEIELRVRFDDRDGVIDQIPLAVVYIGTDSKEEIWFQISLVDLDDIVLKLNRTRIRLKKAADLKAQQR